MTLQNFINDALSPWLNTEGIDNDIVLSSRIRLARNFEQVPFPTSGDTAAMEKVLQFIDQEFNQQTFQDFKQFQLVKMSDLKPIEKRGLVEKHLISPNLAENEQTGAVLISKNEQASVMVNEEDHLRIQLYFPGFELTKALEKAEQLDDWFENRTRYAFDEKRGYLTSCPTNVGTGLRASVMMHLPALSMTNQMNNLIPEINKLGLVVRGIYGEGSEALGQLYQVSNQMTLGKSEEDIVEDLKSVVKQVIESERRAREWIMEQLGIQLEDRIFRSYGILANSRVIQSKEAAKCLSDVRLGIDMGMIKNVPKTILNELMVLTQPAFLQQYAKKQLAPNERDVFRANLIRERLQLEH
ncbi:protein arginine kinase [Tenuibacillus multivorans]|uniref:Protein-arginine kinase n=1 Tax=Tenuibacillus multivorans TaxID=237069 RepID=A0A1H0F2Y8_9BACI|nr:protein arginine kinase [Tenuibacillus multivorans]GEL78096.1 protein-arginine kinase [Tenuibacillus multivorans]SDN88923.1 protein arginine kinase [Tenuibacillus multivorans]